jgi:uncharacterized protein YbaR (Trm112 family)
MIVFCSHCDTRVDAREIGAYPHEAVFGDRERIALLSCPSCTGPLLVSQYLEKDGSGSEPSMLYPAERKVDRDVPEMLRRSFEEALGCYRARCYVACAIMCRRTLEGLCHHHLPAVGNLAQGLKRLYQDGVIDGRLSEWAEALRLDGNFAAHEPAAAIDMLHARDMVDFTEAILEYVFVLARRFESYKARRAAKDKGRNESGGRAGLNDDEIRAALQKATASR